MHSKTHANNMKSLAGLTYHASVVTNKLGARIVTDT